MTKANFCLALFVRNCVLRELRGEKCSKLTFFEFFKFSGLSINNKFFTRLPPRAKLAPAVGKCCV